MKINAILARIVVLGVCLLGVTTVEAVNYAVAARGVSKKIGPKVVNGVKSLYKSYNSEEARTWRRLHNDVWIPCVNCWFGKVTCPNCLGKGQVPSYDMFGNLWWNWCAWCMATGKIPCRECGGSGRVILIEAPMSH